MRPRSISERFIIKAINTLIDPTIGKGPIDDQQGGPCPIALGQTKKVSLPDPGANFFPGHVVESPSRNRFSLRRKVLSEDLPLRRSGDQGCLPTEFLINEFVNSGSISS